MKPFYEEGRYRCRVVSQALGKASTGTPQFVLRFTVLGTMIDDQDYSPVTQYERTMYRYITDKTIEYVKEDLQALNYNRESFKYLDPNQSGFEDFRGLELTMFCSHENDRNGDPRERWGIARGTSELKVDPLEAKAVRELDNLFGKYLKGIAPKPVAAARPTAQPGSLEAEGITDDDVPF